MHNSLHNSSKDSQQVSTHLLHGAVDDIQYFNPLGHHHTVFNLTRQCCSDIKKNKQVDMFAAIWILLPKKFQIQLNEKYATLPGPLTDSHFLPFLWSLSFMQVPCIVAEALSRGTLGTST